MFGVGNTLGVYRLLELIGEGGMGRVYLAEHEKLGRRVAIKVLQPEMAAKRSAVARFFQEAKLVNRIRHRNIVDVTDFVELSDGTAFIVMELLEGQSLRDLKKASGSLPATLVVDICLQICDALEATHGIRVIHRDLKPANIFICRDQYGGVWVKLLDFGIAKLVDVELDEAVLSGVRTAEGAVLGTPAYMSPEQAAGEPLDQRSDVYALGTIMFELICGRPPFVAKRLVDYVHHHAATPPPRPGDTASGIDVPADLEAIIMRCLAKRPEDRYDSVTDLREDLRATREAIRTGVASGSSRRWWAIAAVLLLAGGGFWAAYGLTGNDSGERARELPPRDTVPLSAPVVTPLPASDAAPAPVADRPALHELDAAVVAPGPVTRPPVKPIRKSWRPPPERKAAPVDAAPAPPPRPPPDPTDPTVVKDVVFP